MITLHPFTAQGAANRAHLRIMATTDLHAHVSAYDYFADRPSDSLGLAHTVTLMAAAREQARNSLLIDNGDFLQGNPLADYIAFERGMRPGDIHPVIAAMNAAGFEASTLGNHEFNYGLDFLMDAIAGADFPIVSANVALWQGANPRADKTLLPPYVMLDRMLTDGAGITHPIRIGLIGVLPPQITVWDRRHLQGRVRARDILDAAEAWVPQMREAGCDLILALCHSGIGARERTDGMENAAIPLARVPGVDALLVGHSHLVFPSPAFDAFPGLDVSRGLIEGKPAVMGGFWGSHLGLIDLLLERDGGEWRVLQSEIAARKVPKETESSHLREELPATRAVLASVKAEHEATLAYTRRAVGRTEMPLHTYFALVAECAALRLIALAQKWHITELLAGTEFAHLPLLSATAPFKAGGRSGPAYYTDVPAGELAFRNIADLYLYPNAVCAVKVTGSEVKDWLERSAGVFRQITPGQDDQLLRNTDYSAYYFDVIEGLSYQIDLSQPSKFALHGGVQHADACRIVNLAHAGRPLDPEQEFVVATDAYRASGGGDFPGAKGDSLILAGSAMTRDVLLRFIASQGTALPPGDSGWGFLPMRGASVLFDSGPGAVKYLGEVAHRGIKPAGEGPDGFLRFRMRL